LLKTNSVRKGYGNISTRTAISNLQVAFKIPCKVQQTEVIHVHEIENIQNNGQGKVQQENCCT
jgi:hypothetical protein